MIGIFDSGSGGLTVLKEVRTCLPNADIVYFGDLKNAPYGNKGAEEIGLLTFLGFKKLIELGASKIVSACNSASANILLPYMKEINLTQEDLVEMVGPTVHAFRGDKKSNILLVATEATIRSGIYQEAFKGIGLSIQVLALPYLAGAIESNTSKPAIRAMIENALEAYNGTYDILILGCTHFPLVRDLFERNVPNGIKVFDPAMPVAKDIARKFSEAGKGETKFVISDESSFFRSKIEEFFGHGDYTVDVIK